ncbi:MAG: CTP synthase, partial [Bacteroidales bacterium]|nr:CTP synthase [Bacteroidales bacterium]
NNRFKKEYEEAGMIPTGMNTKDDLVEIIEVKDHPWFMGVQFHPEYKSTVANPHPVFVNFVNAAKAYVETK